jgi:hypothetical protein
MSSVNVVGVEPRLSLLEAEVESGGGGGGDSMWTEWPEEEAIKPKNSKYVGVPNSTNTSGSLISATGIAVATPNEGRAITAVPLTRGDNVIAERDLNTDDFDLVDAKIVIKNRAVPVQASNGSTLHTSTINNAGNSVTMSIEDVLYTYSSFQMTPGRIILDTPCVDFAFNPKSVTNYFRLKYDNGYFVYSLFTPSSEADTEIYRIGLLGNIVLNELTFKGTGTTVTSCLPEPQYYLPVNLKGTVIVTSILGMKPVSITVGATNDFRMTFSPATRWHPFSENVLNFYSVKMAVHLEWTDGTESNIEWYIGLERPGITKQTYKLTDPGTYIDIQLAESTQTLSAVTDLEITCVGVTPLYQ